jgi:hypothetical protein
MRTAQDAHTKSAAPELEEVVSALGEISTGARPQWGAGKSEA